MHRSVVLLFLCALLAVRLPRLAVAQDTTGTITGVVQDPSGASVPGVQVKILNDETGFSRTVETNATGEYKVPFIPVGFYSVTVQKAGFKTQQQKGVRIEILGTMQWHAGLVAASPENFGQSVEGAVAAFIAALHRCLIDVGLLGNFLGQGLVPKLPPEMLGQSSRDLCAPTPVLTLNRNDPKHGAPDPTVPGLRTTV